jgi:hypothetical protein
VEPQRGFLLHTLDWGGQESVQVADRWALTATLDILRAIAEGRGPSRWIAALGYAGWGSGQLEDELCRNGWFSRPAMTSSYTSATSTRAGRMPITAQASTCACSPPISGRPESTYKDIFIFEIGADRG